jgi:hypothetical protein
MDLSSWDGGRTQVFLGKTPLQVQGVFADPNTGHTLLVTAVAEGTPPGSQPVTVWVGSLMSNIVPFDVTR